MNLTVSATVVMTYRPALAFARRVKEWHEATAKLNSPHQMGEPPMLVLLYSLLSLEAFISEQLTDRRQQSEYAHLYRNGISLAQRWAKGTALLKAATPRADRAVATIAAACQDTGAFGLLVVHVTSSFIRAYMSRLAMRAATGLLTTR